MGQRRIAARQVRRETGSARANPAVKIGPDLCADPFVVLVGGTGDEVEARCGAIDELVGHVLEQYPVRGALGRPGRACRYKAQPGPGDVRRVERRTFVLQQQEGEYRVIDVVIGFASGDMTATAGPAEAVHEGAFLERHIVPKGQRAHVFEIIGQAIPPLPKRQHLDRLAQQTTGYSALPGCFDPRWIDTIRLHLENPHVPALYPQNKFRVFLDSAVKLHYNDECDSVVKKYAGTTEWRRYRLSGAPASHSRMLLGRKFRVAH